MNADDLLRQLKAGKREPAYLFLGPDAWRREECRDALRIAALPEEDREQGYTRLDLDEVDLAYAIDDACSYSLFASNRLIWISSAESALPRGDATEAPDQLVRYMKDPPPGVTLVLQCSRFDLTGDDKPKADRVRKFFAPVKAVVELPHPNALEARALAQRLAKQAGIAVRNDALDLLVEATGSNASRIANEMQKLALLTKSATLEDVRKIVPDAREATVFQLAAALGRRDRKASLELLDTIVRDGEYLPLALNSLASQFRFAITAREAKLTNAGAIQKYFNDRGVSMWRGRAEQVSETAAAFRVEQMRAAVQWIFEADRGLRDTRPDDRTVMEQFILRLTSTT